MTNLLCQVDQAGAEALIVAYECEPGRYRDLFLNNIKPHVYLGLAFYKHWEKAHPYIHEIRQLPIPKISLHPGWKALSSAIKDSDSAPPSRRYYYLYKQTCHSSNYGVEAPTFRNNILEKSEGKVALSKYDSEIYLQTYHENFPEIRRWNERIIRQLEKTKTLRNLFGFPREFTGYIHRGMYKEALAFIPQSTVGCITIEATCNLQDYVENCNLHWDYLNNKHDSYLWQAPGFYTLDSYNERLYKGEILELAPKMKEFMEIELTSSNGDVYRMKAEVSIGKNWGKYSERNPDGLKEIKL